MDMKDGKKEARTVLSANIISSVMFRIVFWDVLSCKIIVDRRFRGA
jgi:hypothetical protein